MWFEWRSALAAYVWLQYGATLLLSALAAQKFGAVEFPNFMFHWAAARACGSAFASAVLWAREVRGPKRAAEPLVVTRASFLGCVPPFLTNVGYVAFTALASAGGDVSILSGLATLHGLFPAVIGLFCFKEPRTTLRLAGLAAAAAAIVLMGVSTDTVPSEASWPWYARGGLFVVAICAWGLNDTASARIARHTSLRQVMLQSAVAYLVLATCWAQAAFASGSVGGRFGGMQAMLWAANFSLIFGWLGYVKLGEVMDASKFSPFVATYGAVPVLFGFLFNAEDATATKVLGVLCSVCAAALSSTTRKVPWDRFVDVDDSAAAAGARAGVGAGAGAGTPEPEPEDRCRHHSTVAVGGHRALERAGADT